MRQLNNFGDARLEIGFCSYCGEETDTKDHIVSRVFLDKPYPDNLPTIPACLSCNQGFSLDEEYFACLIECVIAGVVDAKYISREKIIRILDRKPKLANKLKKARRNFFGQKFYFAEDKRIEKIVVKIAKGLAAFELNEPKLEMPNQITTSPLISIVKAERDYFEAIPEDSLFPELGTRAMQRRAVNSPPESQWINLQENRFRFLTIAGPPLIIRMVISEYLACEVIWNF